MIKDYLDREIRVKINDDREFQGYLRCIDKDLNLILQECVEFSTEQRVLGHVMVPGNIITSIDDPIEYI